MTKENKTKTPASNTSRRDFIKKSSLLVAGGTVAGGLSLTRSAHAFGADDTIKIGLVGCGGRGTGAAIQALNTQGPTKLVAMGDVFSDHMASRARAIKGQHPQKFDVPEEHQFVGFDAYKKVLETECDLVILATPPGFRPLHVEAAVDAGKHVFMEKPVAVDAPGVRRVLAATEKAKQKGLAIAVGLQRHHETVYEETIKRLQDGAIGDIILTRVYWNSGGVWDPRKTRDECQSELEYQVRNWYYYNWLCGDHIAEQHIHNLDVSNWLMDGYPVKCNGQGGREVRTDKKYGQIFDHHFIEYEYANGTRMYSQCRHIRGAWSSVSEHCHGTKGSADISGGRIFNAAGEEIFSYRKQFGRGGRNGHQEEHHDLFAALRKGELPNEGEYGAKSTMTAILGRMATYSGKAVTWDAAINSDKSLANVDELVSFKSEAPIKPNEAGEYAVPVPGVTETV